jgi:hypothetical protein
LTKRKTQTENVSEQGAKKNILTVQTLSERKMEEFPYTS